MVQMDAHRHRGAPGKEQHDRGHFLHGAQPHGLMHLCVHQDHRALLRLGRADHGAHAGQVWGVERADGDFFLLGYAQDLFQCN